MTSETGSTLVGIGAIASPVMIFALGALQIFATRRAEKGREEVAQKVATATQAVQKVATVAAETAKDAKDTAGKTLVLIDKTHTLVNSKMGVVLRKAARKARDLAQAIPTTTNLQDADDAEQELAEHQKNQSTVDDKEKLGTG